MPIRDQGSGLYLAIFIAQLKDRRFPLHSPYIGYLCQQSYNYRTLSQRYALRFVEPLLCTYDGSGSFPAAGNLAFSSRTVFYNRSTRSLPWSAYSFFRQRLNLPIKFACIVYIQSPVPSTSRPCSSVNSHHQIQHLWLLLLPRSIATGNLEYFFLGIS